MGHSHFLPSKASLGFPPSGSISNLPATLPLCPITSWQLDGETMVKETDFIFLGSKITAKGDYSHEIKRRLFLGKKSYDQPRQHIKKQRCYFANKGLSSQSYGFSSSHVWMRELDHKES